MNQDAQRLYNIRADWRRNWRVGLAVTVGMGFGTSILPSIFSVFILPLQHAFGWSRGAIGLANGASLVGGIAAPFVGRLIDGVGVRRPLLAGTAVLGLSWAALAAMPGSLGVFYMLFLMVTLCGLLTAGITYSHIICANFTQSRGFSLAVSRSGVAVSAAVLPTLLNTMIRNGGWRAGFLTLAALVLLVSFPIVMAWTRTRYELHPGGEPVALSLSRPVLSTATRRYTFSIALAAALAYLPLLAIMSQAQPLLIDRGLPAERAAHVVGLFGVASFIGAIGTGFLLDRFWAPAVACTLLMLGATGTLILGFGPASTVAAAIAVMLLGLTLGAEIDLVAFVVARYCGVRGFGSVFGFSYLAISFASALGSSTIGFLYDATGSYRLALLLGALSFSIAACAYLSLGRYPQPAPD